MFIKEAQQIEEGYAKQMGKLSVQVSRNTGESSVSPLWQNVLKDTIERNARSHLHFCTRMQEMQRDVQAYSDELRKKRRYMRGVETKTANMVEKFRAARSQLNRARDAYMSLAGDGERQKKGLLIDGSLADKLASTVPLQQSHSASSALSFPVGMVTGSNSGQRVLI